MPREQKWFVEIQLRATGKTDREHAATLFLEVYAEEWGYRFERDGRTSWIRVTDVPFVHGRDEHALLTKTPRLDKISALIREIEREHGIVFERGRSTIRSNVRDDDGVIRSWIAQL